MERDIIQYFKHGGHWRKMPKRMATMCVISLQIATQMENFSILRTRRLPQGRLYYLNPPLVTFAHKTRILYGFEAETSIYVSKICRFSHLYRKESLPSIDQCFLVYLKDNSLGFRFYMGLWR